MKSRQTVDESRQTGCQMYEDLQKQKHINNYYTINLTFSMTKGEGS